MNLKTKTKLKKSPPLANHLCQVIQLEALVTANGELLVVVLPGGKKEKLAALAGIHALASWFGEVGEAVFLEDDEGKAFVEGGAHDGLLS